LAPPIIRVAVKAPKSEDVRSSDGDPLRIDNSGEENQMDPGAKPLPDVIAEAHRLGEAFAAAGVRARLLGGCGIALHAHREIPPPLRRAYGDLDYVVRRSEATSYRRVIESAGYEPNVRFNNVNGHRRLLHLDSHNDRQVDTFIGSFHMCHDLDLDTRLPENGLALAPADLLLTKLQVVEINEKDLTDTVLLLTEHPVGDADPEVIDRRRIAAVVGSDWGWHTTLSDNLERLEDRARLVHDLDEPTRDLVVGRVRDLQTILAAAPKSARWRLRARVGRRMPWYDLPEEVARG
jgi:hypothetical protein